MLLILWGKNIWEFCDPNSGSGMRNTVAGRMLLEFWELGLAMTTELG
jgi:hypothetical protein